jgi:hypothetical protein
MGVFHDHQDRRLACELLECAVDGLEELCPVELTRAVCWGGHFALA